MIENDMISESILRLILKYIWHCISPDGGKLQWIFIQIQNSSQHFICLFIIEKCIIFNNSYLRNFWSEYYQFFTYSHKQVRLDVPLLTGLCVAIDEGWV